MSAQPHEAPPVDQAFDPTLRNGHGEWETYLASRPALPDGNHARVPGSNSDLYESTMAVPYAKRSFDELAADLAVAEAQEDQTRATDIEQGILDRLADVSNVTDDYKAHIIDNVYKTRDAIRESLVAGDQVMDEAIAVNNGTAPSQAPASEGVEPKADTAPNQGTNSATQETGNDFSLEEAISTAERNAEARADSFSHLYDLLYNPQGEADKAEGIKQLQWLSRNGGPRLTEFLIYDKARKHEAQRIQDANRASSASEAAGTSEPIPTNRSDAEADLTPEQKRAALYEQIRSEIESAEQSIAREQQRLEGLKGLLEQLQRDDEAEQPEAPEEGAGSSDTLVDVGVEDNGARQGSIRRGWANLRRRMGRTGTGTSARILNGASRLTENGDDGGDAEENNERRRRHTHPLIIAALGVVAANVVYLDLKHNGGSATHHVATAIGSKHPKGGAGKGTERSAQAFAKAKAKADAAAANLSGKGQHPHLPASIEPVNLHGAREPWNWAADVFGKKDATAELNRLVAKGQKLGVPIREKQLSGLDPEGHHLFEIVLGKNDTNTEDVVTVLNGLRYLN